MNEFFASVKADLTDRRMLPVVAAVCVLMVAALAYALLGGHSSSSGTSTPVPAPVPQLPTGISVTGAQARSAVAETTDGFLDQKHGVARNPFAPLPGSEPSPTSTTATVSSTPSSASSTTTSTTTSGTESSGSSTGSSGSSPSSTPNATKPSGKSKAVYNVTVKFGTLPPGITPETAQLHEYTKLKLQTVLPAPQLPLLVFRGVTAKGKSATFTLVGEAILTGVGSCLPSPQQCQVLDLKPGETEQLEYLGPNGEATIYELRVLTIEGETAKAASAKASAASRHPGSAEWGVSRVGQELLRKAGLVALPFLRYSSQPGVLVFSPPHAKKTHHGAAASAGHR